MKGVAQMEHYTRVLGLLLPLFTCMAASTSWGECVEQCTDEPGDNILMVVAADGYESVQPGEQLVVELWQTNLTQLVRGYQAFLEFDATCLAVDSIAIPEDPNDGMMIPYGLEIRKAWDNLAGTIDLIYGINDLVGQPPTDADALLAVITFNALAECEIEVCFRVNNPPSRFTDEAGGPVDPCLKFTGPLCIDATPPELTCPPDEDLQCEEELPDPAPDQVVCDDNCPWSCWVEWVGDEYDSGEGCEGDPLIITRTYQGTDAAGNVGQCVQTFTVADTIAPTCADLPQVFVQCFDDIPPANESQVACEDNCLRGCTVQWVDDEENGGAGCSDDPLIVTRTYRATDYCGNTTDVTQTIWVIDVTPPTILHKPDDVVGQCDVVITPPDPNAIDAIDNCGGDVEVIWICDESNDGSGCPDDPLITTRTYHAIDLCGNIRVVTQTFTVIDDTPPEINGFPPNEYLYCNGGAVPPCDPNLVSAVDNCWDPNDPNSVAPEVICLDDTDNGGLGCPSDDPNDALANALIIWRTYRVTDRCGNYTDRVQTFTVIDDYPPTITAPPNVAVQCDAEIPPVDFAGGTIEDTCDPDPDWVWCGDADNGGSGCPGDPLIITRCYLGVDRCGNESQPVYQTITVVDNTPPQFVAGCDPQQITVYPDAGEHLGAYANLEVPEVVDNCDGLIEPEPYRSDGRELDEMYPAGQTTIVWWIATDSCGNTNACLQRVNVPPQNLVEAYVELQGILASPLSRCIDFELWNCPVDGPLSVVELEIQFATNASDRSTGLGEFAVPAGLYTCMTAQDRLHTLRSAFELTTVEYVDEEVDDTVRTKYRAEYADPRVEGEIGHWLVGGNFDACANPDDEFVDILDFGVFSSEFGQCYDSDGDEVCDGNTPCPACDWYPHADANGDGIVNTADFSFISLNILQAYEPPCCEGDDGGGAPGVGVRPTRTEPVTRISVAELRSRGLGALAAGDLTGDGWLDLKDVEAFAQGARPQPTQKASKPGAIEP